MTKEERIAEADARLAAAEKLVAETEGWDDVPDADVMDFAYPQDGGEGTPPEANAAPVIVQQQPAPAGAAPAVIIEHFHVHVPAPEKPAKREVVIEHADGSKSRVVEE